MAGQALGGFNTDTKVARRDSGQASSAREETLRYWRGPVSRIFAARSRPGVHGCLPQGPGIRDEIHWLLAQHALRLERAWCQDLEAVGPGEKIPLTKHDWYGIISFRKLPSAVSAF